MSCQLKKLGRAEGGTNIFGVFRVKNHDFTPKNHIFSNFREGGPRAGCGSPGSAPDIYVHKTKNTLFAPPICVQVRLPTILKINPKLYTVPKIFVSKSQ
jgi:hypothetical protein